MRLDPFNGVRSLKEVPSSSDEEEYRGGKERGRGKTAAWNHLGKLMHTGVTHREYVYSRTVLPLRAEAGADAWHYDKVESSISDRGRRLLVRANSSF